MQRDRLRRIVNRLRERLWVKPLLSSLLSVGAALLARVADDLSGLGRAVPAIQAESIESLLSIMAASMLVIATFAVASMVSAYASASSAATPRCFALVIADDVSQNALSTFIGAFIYSIVALTAVKNEYYQEAGRFTLFVLTGVVFAIVVLTFVRWVDRIARLGRMGTTIEKVERATSGALKRRRERPTMGCAPAPFDGSGQAVLAERVGYVQQVDVGALQACAERVKGRVLVAALPGTFAAPGRPLAYLRIDPGEQGEFDPDQVMESFRIGRERVFDDDPRFGLVVLSEIAGRALSPAVNDPGTAIDVLGTLVRLFAQWGAPGAPPSPAPTCGRVEMPELSVHDMLDDAFTAIARDGAGIIEVEVRLHKALGALAAVGDEALRAAAQRHSRLALARAEQALTSQEELASVRETARWAAAPEPEPEPEPRDARQAGRCASGSGPVNSRDADT